MGEMSEDRAPGNVVPLNSALPLQELTGEPGVQRPRGRPKKVETRPDLYDAWYHQQISEERRQHIDADEVVAAVRGRSEAREVLQGIRRAVAEEAAALQFQRRELEKRGRDAAQISTRRIDALVQLGRIELELRKLYAQEIDLRGERFQKVFRLWVEDLQAILVELLTAPQTEVFFARLQSRMENWEDRAESIIR